MNGKKTWCPSANFHHLLCVKLTFLNHQSLIFPRVKTNLTAASFPLHLLLIPPSRSVSLYHMFNFSCLIIMCNKLQWKCKCTMKDTSISKMRVLFISCFYAFFSLLILVIFNFLFLILYAMLFCNSRFNPVSDFICRITFGFYFSNNG